MLTAPPVTKQRQEPLPLEPIKTDIHRDTHLSRSFPHFPPRSHACGYFHHRLKRRKGRTRVERVENVNTHARKKEKLKNTEIK